MEIIEIMETHREVAVEAVAVDETMTAVVVEEVDAVAVVVAAAVVAEEVAAEGIITGESSSHFTHPNQHGDNEI